MDTKRIPDELKDPEFTEMCTKSYGLLAIRQDGVEIVSNIIRKGTTKPARKKLGTGRANQISIKLKVYENDNLQEEVAIEDCIQMYDSCEIKLTPGLSEGAPIKIIFDLDCNGELNITTVDLANNVPLTVRMKRIGGEACNVGMDKFSRGKI